MPEREPSLLKSELGREPSTPRGAAPAAAPVAAAMPTTAANPELAELRAPARSSAPTFYVAGFWRRLVGGLIDSAIILPVSLLMCWLAGAIGGVSLPASRHRGLDFWLDLLLASDPALLGALGLTLAIAAVYLLVFQITLGRTLGMRTMKIRIIDIYGDDPSTARAVVRTLGYLAGFATLGLGFLWAGFDSEKRGLHDWISRTYVVKA